MITVAVADDQTLIRTALATTIDLEDDLQVVGQAATCAEVVTMAGTTQPDVVLLDVQMPTGGLAVEDGIDTLPLLLRAAPSAKVIVVTTFGRPGYLRRALESGAVGFMVKDAPVDHLLTGIRRAAQGFRVVDPELAAASLSIGASPLGEKEALVLAASAGGASTQAIAQAVHLSEGTVRNYLSAAVGKMGARNRAEALRQATENGWV